ncbi:MAG: PIN domain-containing protein [Spirochaetales bacterium]|nr:PIN domain-containing protein [Spirochaetales bacterium]
MKVLIDTNIALDLMTNRQDFQDDAAKVFTLCAGGLTEGFLSANSVCDLHYILHRHFHDESVVRTTLETWLNLVGVLDVNGEDCINAMRSQTADYEDAVIQQAAARNRCDYIVTRNLRDFEFSPVQAISPKEFIKLALKR